MSAICGAPCRYGGVAATRKHSSAELGWMGHCNRSVGAEGDRCWQHQRGRCICDRVAEGLVFHTRECEAQW